MDPWRKETLNLEVGVSPRLSGPVVTIPGLLKADNISVGNIFGVTHPVYENPMIGLTAADFSSLSYRLPFLLDDQYDIHHFALVFLQLILECHAASLAHTRTYSTSTLNHSLISSLALSIVQCKRHKSPWGPRWSENSTAR